MASIRRLDPALVNKIAAGEVIERPASVVKELLENALDAGAARIELELEEGGCALVSVSDDGQGIAADELPLALAPHATSKLASADDLLAIATMGFRGEALASIASVSRLKLTSRPPGQVEAAVIEASDAGISAVRPAAAPVGTTVEVRQLFYNLPARRKYLRSASAELAHASEQVARVALAHPRVALAQSHNGRPIRRLPATDDRLARIADFFGTDLANDLIPFSRQEAELRVEGYFAPPAASRASSRWQYCFLNGRYIRDRELSGFVLREAFRGLIEPARYPVVFLFLTADPASFDVNVHPCKIEVRWRDAARVKSQVLAVLREALLSRDLTPRFHAGRPVDAAAAQANMHALAERMRAWQPAAHRRPADGSGESGGGPVAAVRGAGAMHSWEPVAAAPGGPGACSGPPLARDAEPGATEAAAEAIVAGPVPAALPGRAIQIHNTYLVCETPDGMLIVDQHALHERILYEEFSARMAAGPLESQRLLLPETLDASPAQLEALEAAQEVLQRLGLDIEPFGPRSVVVRGGPSLLGDADLRGFVADLLDQLSDAERRDSESLLHALLAMMACKAAVKAGDRLSTETIDALLARRHLVERSSNCPHGRPTTLRLTVRDLERQFKRA